MVDPFGITAGVIGFALSALHSARRLKELIDGIQGAPEAVRALSEDLYALQDVLKSLNTLLQDTRFTGRRGRAEAMPALEPHLKNCADTLDSMFLAIARHTKSSGDPSKSKWSSFVWYFREKELLTLQNRLKTYKMSLDLAVSIANLTSSSSGFNDIRRSIHGMRKRIEEDRESTADSSFMGSSIASSDCGFAMKKWLRQTESIIGDGPPCSPISVSDTAPSEVANYLSHRSEPASSFSNPFDDDIDDTEQRLWTNSEGKEVAASFEGRENKCQEEAPPLVSSYHPAELLGSRETPAIFRDRVDGNFMALGRQTSSADPVSSGIQILDTLKTREYHETNPKRNVLRPVASAHSLGEPESLVARHQHLQVTSKDRKFHRSASALFESSTPGVRQTISSNAKHPLERHYSPERQSTLINRSSTTEDGTTPKKEHEIHQQSGQADRPFLHQVQTAPTSRTRWSEAMQVDYEGSEYGNDDSNYLKPRSAITSNLSLESLARRDGTLVPHFVRECIMMLDTHGLDLAETYRDSVGSDELRRLLLLLADNTNLELGLIMNLGRDYPTQEHLVKIRAILRQFFKALKEPLFTAFFYSEISAAAMPEPVYSRYQIKPTVLRDTLSRLPKAHYETAKHVILYLHRVCQSRSTQHTANKKLASAWANVLLLSDLFSTSQERENRELLLQTIISQAPMLFSDEPHPRGN